MEDYTIGDDIIGLQIKDIIDLFRALYAQTNIKYFDDQVNSLLQWISTLSEDKRKAWKL